ncbi:hypothetical protein BESB_044420 [Besnoitia besnoiti]|uniref:Uncharacterized protein n=1 Tax=Besnoitia besnoiti TaxID=94643 RepID=A0A2A9MLB6_BESBE|nr:hypothetical protein BESB_044420 [Besnoitia besnoiti]PFH36250.1 hypothetical protein BESB_044420 [Besnoitia besnoiti]
MTACSHWTHPPPLMGRRTAGRWRQASLWALFFCLLIIGFLAHGADFSYPVSASAAERPDEGAYGASNAGGSRGDGSEGGFSLSSLLSMTPSSETVQQLVGDLAKQATEFLKDSSKLEQLGLGPLQDNLERFTSMLGVRPDLKRMVMLNRRRLEVMYMPVFVFSRQRALDKNAEADDATLAIVLRDPHMTRFLGKYGEVEPLRTMSTAPKQLDSFLKQIQELQQYVLLDGPVVFSLVSRLDAIVATFLDYTTAMFSALARYLSLTGRFAKNKRALFFFGKYTLPRLLKIFLVVNNIQAQLLRKSQALESPEDGKQLRKMLRTSVKKTTEAVNSLHDFSKGCLIGCSASFQIEYAASLKDYEEGERVEIAFRRFAGSPALEGVSLPSSDEALSEMTVAARRGALDASQYLRVMQDQAQEDHQLSRREHGSTDESVLRGIDPAGAALGAGLGFDGEPPSTAPVAAPSPPPPPPPAADVDQDRAAARELLDSY